MAKRLNEDEIKWILSVESGQAQQEIYKLTKANRELNRTNQERRNVMRSLEAQGKKDTEYYRNLEKEIKSTNDVIKKNSTLVGELEKKLDVTGLTMAQLRKKAKELRTQLDNTAQAANPEEYAKLEAELTKVNNRMRDLNNTGAYAKTEITGFEKAMSMAKTAAKGFIAVQLVSYLKNIGTNAYNTRKEFARYEATLKNVTGSGKEASQIMRTLQNLAADTPASVAEWTEAYIKLVNRGIKPTTSELTALGDIATSQGKSLDQFVEAFLDALTGENERLKEFGITAQKNGETTAFTFKGITTEVENNDQAIKNYIISLGNLKGVQGSMATQMNELAGLESNLGDQMDSIYNKIGKKLEPMIKSFMGTLGNLMGTLSSALDSANDRYEQQKEKVVTLYSEYSPLLDRYDQLKAKTNLSNAEQQELNSIINKITNAIPGVVTEVGKYGEALGISSEKAREFIENQKTLLKYMNRDAIFEEEKRLEEYKKKYENARQAQIAGGVYVTSSASITGYSTSFFDNSPQTLKRIDEDVKKYSDLIKGSEALLEELRGDSLQKALDNNNARIKMQDEFNKMNKQQLDAWINDEKNAQSEYLEIAQQIYNSRFPTERITSKELEKERKKKLKEEAKEAKDILKTEKDVIKSLQTLRDEDLINQEKNYNQQIYLLNLSLQKKKITQEQFDLMKIVLDRKNAELKLNIEKSYYSDAESLQITHNEIKEDLIKKSNERVVSSEKEANEKRIAEQNKMNNLVSDFKNQFKILTPYEDYEIQQKILTDIYEARKEALEKEHLDTLALDEAYYEASLKLKKDFEDKKNAIEDRYGLRSLKEKYLEELEIINEYYKQGLISSENIVKTRSKVFVDYISNLADTWINTFSTLFQSLQDLELKKLDAQYDAQIEAAKENSDQVEQLEEEKEKKKLAIQKKYASVNFAIKVSQIIADTAVAVMKAFADLGPVAGAVAAALMSATGAAQVAAANAERKKIMSMNISESSNSTRLLGSTRVPGKESGGYINVTRSQDGKQFNAEYSPSRRGFIDRPTVIVGEGPAGMSREWVASNAAVMNPTVSPILNVIDKAQQAGTIRSLNLNRYIQARMLGRESGGSVGTTASSVPAVVPDYGLTKTVGELNYILRGIKEKGIPAYTLLSDLNRAQELQNKSRKIGSK